jgi:hypothetical protein
MASTTSPEDKELALVGKVELRIALAETDKKLEDLLRTYLAPLLLKLGSQSVAVRNKVRRSDGIFSCISFIQSHNLAILHFWTPLMRSLKVISICQHINTRIKPQYVSFQASKPDFGANLRLVRSSFLLPLF